MSISSFANINFVTIVFTIKTKVKLRKVPTRQDKETPGQRSARTKIEWCNDIGIRTFPYGKTTGHTDVRRTANGPTSTKQSGLQSGCLICVSM